ncbi:hypothetical protein [Nocardia abscessus]|uniref:hypothetical protein n=1 Tax=Nocardia abscessus TaxID=120957 RepID=UPI002456552A|nr:hypothetical protein [Nocardia abscessus]
MSPERWIVKLDPPAGVRAGFIGLLEAAREAIQTCADLPGALGFLRTDIAGSHQKWLETQMRSSARGLMRVIRREVMMLFADRRPARVGVLR